MATKDKLPAIIHPEVDNPPADFGVLIEKGGEVFGRIFADNSAAQIKIAEINLPVTKKAQEIQEEQLRRNWNHIDEERNARIGNEKRGHNLIFAVVAFLLIVASIFIYQNDKQNAMSIITAVLGFIAGFFSGQGWASKSQATSSGNK